MDSKEGGGGGEGVVANNISNNEGLNMLRIYVRWRLQGQKALDKVVGGLGDAWLDIGDCQDLHKTVM